MNWIVLALFAPVFDTAVNFIDKYLVGEKLEDYRAVPIFMGIIGTLAGILLYALRGFQTMSGFDIPLILLAGVLTYFSIYYYFKALDFEETSVVVILFQASPLITLALSALFLREVITLTQLLGFILVLAASTTVSLDSVSPGRFTLSRSFYYIMASNVFWSCAAILYKSTAESNDLLSTLGVEGMGIGLGACIAFTCDKSVRNAFLTTIPKVSPSVFALLTLNEIMSLAAKWIVFLAVLLGPVALVDVVVSVQIFYAIITGWLLTKIFPKIFKEDISRKGLTLKLLAGLTLMLGIYLIA